MLNHAPFLIEDSLFTSLVLSSCLAGDFLPFTYGSRPIGTPTPAVSLPLAFLAYRTIDWVWIYRGPGHRHRGNPTHIPRLLLSILQSTCRYWMTEPSRSYMFLPCLSASREVFPRPHYINHSDTIPLSRHRELIKGSLSLHRALVERRYIMYSQSVATITELFRKIEAMEGSMV